MPNYDDFVKKAKDALDTIADVSVEAYKLAEEKAKILTRKTKLNAEITREKVAIRRLKAEIGGVYYDLHKDDPEEDLKQGCEEITAALDSIAAKKRELEELKTVGVVKDEADDEAACDCESEPACECEIEPACECEIEPAPESDAKDDTD